MPVITWVRTGTDNQKFKLEKAVLPDTATVVSSSSDPSTSSGTAEPGSSSSGTTAIRADELRNRTDLRLPQRKQKYRDLKGRRYDKQIPYRVMF